MSSLYRTYQNENPIFTLSEGSSESQKSGEPAVLTIAGDSPVQSHR